MRLDELYKFSDGTLTRLLTSLEDITNNINMEYVPKRRWSSLKKKRAHIMIKAINKLLKERWITRSLEKFNTSAGNPVKEILLKLNLPDHRSILTDSKEYIKMDVERQSVKVKELQERCIIKAFKLSYQEKYEHVGPKSQDHKMARLQDDVKRLCLVDDLKKFKITFISSQRYKSKPKVKDHYNISQVNN
ncbi:hypothetical protein Tco_1504679 [Tanacetum coccineum]